MTRHASVEPLRVLVADDHPVFREGLVSILRALPDVEVVGEAGTGTEAVSAVVDLQPDIVVMDLNMPELSGIEATREIAQTSPHVRVLILTMFEDDDSIFAAMRAGAHGYVLKSATPPAVLRAVQAVGAGEAIFSPAIARRVIAYFAATATGPRLAPFPQLTERERELLNLLAEGHSNALIASRLHLSPKTVRNHVSNIFTKLQVADRAQAIVRAREAGLGA